MKEYTIEEVKSIMEECNHYDGSFEDIYCYDIDSIEEIFNGLEIVRIINMVHFGEYNPNCEYFRFDGYGNIESVYESEYLENIEDREEEILEYAKELGLI